MLLDMSNTDVWFVGNKACTFTRDVKKYIYIYKSYKMQ